MEKEFKPVVESVKIDPSAIKQQYTQMNNAAEQATQQQPAISQEQVENQMRIEEERFDKLLPFYRKQKELYELEVAITTYECKMGKIDATKIPGTIGRQLEIEDMETKLNWAQLKMQQSGLADKLKEEKEKLVKAEKEKESATATDNVEN